MEGRVHWLSLDEVSTALADKGACTQPMIGRSGEHRAVAQRHLVIETRYRYVSATVQGAGHTTLSWLWIA
jgi:hypothetical protein